MPARRAEPAPLLSLRRRPAQPRGLAKVERILDATAALLADTPPDAVTTKAIAERAGTSIGSFYQFFPNRDAAYAALLSRYRSQIRNYVTEQADRLGTGPDDLAEGVGAIIDGLCDLYRRLPGFTSLGGYRLADDDVTHETRAALTEIIDSLDARFAALVPTVDAAERRAALKFIVDTVRLLLFHEGHPLPSPDTQARARRMVVLYLADVFRIGRC